MRLAYKDARLYLTVNADERRDYIPFIYGAKLDVLTGIWQAPVGALIPILTVFPIVTPVDNKTKKLLDEAYSILGAVKKEKEYIKDKVEVKNKDYPFLMSHQAVCNDIAGIRPRYALFLDTGTR